MSIDSIFDFPEGTTAKCVQCHEPILLDQQEGGGTGKDWGAGRPADWQPNGGLGLDYGCFDSPLNDNDGTGGHSPQAGTIITPGGTT